jgi:hypothetical protein
MLFLEITAALLAAKAVADLWDCFGFDCEDICDWVNKRCQRMAQRKGVKHGTTQQPPGR